MAPPSGGGTGGGDRFLLGGTSIPTGQDLVDAMAKLTKMTAVMAAYDVQATKTADAASKLGKALGLMNEGTAKAFKGSIDFFESIGVAVRASEQYDGVINKFLGSIPLVGTAFSGLVKDQYDVAASFSKSTGTGGRYGDTLHSLITSTAGLGVSSEKAGAAAVSLFTGFTDFTMQTEKGRGELAKTVVELEALGMASESTVPSMQVLNKAFGMSNDQIRETMLGIEAFADKAGLNVKDVTKRFQEQIPIFAVYGDNAVSTFQRLEAATKSTGLAMKTMLQTVDSFDTFEGATKSVGSLNQMLGGPYLNAIEMVQETDPVERIKMLKQAFEDAGMSVQDMGYYQKKAFVDMLPGIGNVTELTELLEGDFDALADTIGEVPKTAQEIQAEAFAQMTPRELFDEAIKTAARLEGLIPRVEALTAGSMEQFTDTLHENSGVFGGLVKDSLTAMGTVMGDEYAGKKPLGDLVMDGDGFNIEQFGKVMVTSMDAKVAGLMDTMADLVTAINEAQAGMQNRKFNEAIARLETRLGKPIAKDIADALADGIVQVWDWPAMWRAAKAAGIDFAD